jgi:hypothetical protein
MAHPPVEEYGWLRKLWHNHKAAPKRLNLPFVIIYLVKADFFPYFRHSSHTWHAGWFSKNSRRNKIKVDTPGWGWREIKLKPKAKAASK